MDLSIVVVTISVLFFCTSVVDSFFAVNRIQTWRRDLTTIYGTDGTIGRINVGNHNDTALVLKDINSDRFRNLVTDHRPISKELSKCRTVKAFISFAARKGATVHQGSSSHVKVTKGSISTTFSGGRNCVKQLHTYTLRQIINTFKAMGIAYD